MCGLKWSYDDRELASGGNDNQLLIWNAHSTSPVLRYAEHTAAVKAIAWSPHQHGMLASGGGTADRCLRFWNTATGSSSIACVDTGSQARARALPPRALPLRRVTRCARRGRRCATWRGAGTRTSW